MFFGSAAMATNQTPTIDNTNNLLSPAEIHSALIVKLADSIEAINNVAVKPDLNALIAQTQLETELNQFIEQAKNDLPKNRFKVVFAD